MIEITTADLSAIIYLALFVFGLVSAAWLFNSWCPMSTQETAFLDGRDALQRAERELDGRVRLKQFKE